MAIARTKADLLHEIETAYDALRRDLDRVPAARAREVSLPGHSAGTEMSPADLVAYLVGWNELVLDWHEQRGRGVEPELPAPGYGWNDLGALAGHFYRAGADESWPGLLDRLDRAENGLVLLVRGLDDDQLYGVPWYRAHTAGRMIQLNSASPYANARRRIRAWLREAR